MRRMRARRKLTEILERVSAIFVLPARRIADLAHAMVGVREGFMTGASCILCTVLGIGVAVTVPLGSGTAGASPLHRDGTGERAAIVARSIMLPGDERTSSRAVDVPNAIKPSKLTTRGDRSSAGGSVEGEDGSLPTLPPLPSDPNPEAPTVPLPNRGPQGGPNIPEPPPLPPLPGKSPNGLVGEIEGAVSQLGG